MDKYVVLSVLLGVLLVASVFQAFELNSLKGQLSAKTAAVSASTALQTSSSGGETYEQMMQRMHPELAQQQAAQIASTGGGALNNLPNMVGGC